MKKTFILTPNVPHESPIHFQRDFATSELTGIMQKTLTLVEESKALGYVSIHPIPSGYDFTAPLTNPDQMAAVLGQYWKLSEYLLTVYPKVKPAPSEIEIINDEGNAVGTVPTVQ